MFNVTVIKIKDIFKYLLTFVIIVSIIYMFNRFFYNKKELLNINLNKSIESKLNEYSLDLINLSLPSVNYISTLDDKQLNQEFNPLSEEDDSGFSKDNIMNYLLKLELGVIDFENVKVINDFEDNTKVDNKIEENTQEDNKTQENIELAVTNQQTEIATKNPISENYNKQYLNVKIKNETNFELTEEILNHNNLEINKSNIIIFHTHTCESYTSSEKYTYTPTGNYRTTDLNYSVARVGDELKRYLDAYGFNTLHDKTYHDYPAYTGSYGRSLKTVENLLGQGNSDIIIDLHRDAIGSNSNYDPTIKIGDDYAAQLMFVIGSNGGGLNHPNWNSNLKFAVKVQEKANELYPGLFKPIIFRNSRYNQHLGKAACIIEVGATGNTLEQCMTSMKYLSDVLNKVLQ